MSDAFLKLVYLYSKLFSFGFNRKRFEISVNEDNLFVVNNSKNTLFALLFTFFLSFFLFFGLIEIFKHNPPITPDFIIVCFLIHPIFGLIGLRQFIWLVNGRQELLIEDGFLILRKKGSFLIRSKRYPLKAISNIREAFNEEEPSLIEKTHRNIAMVRKVLLTQTIGAILFEYQYSTIKVFNDINSDEKKELIEAITQLQVKAK